jgi:four helix bundle protein
MCVPIQHEAGVGSRITEGWEDAAMDYEEWAAGVPEAITADSLWRMKAYRLSLFLGDLAWEDIAGLTGHPHARSITHLLYRAVGQIGADIAQGYSRGSGRDQARFYGYALASAREARDWYFKLRHALDGPVVEQRFALLDEIGRLLQAIIGLQRTRSLGEDPRPAEGM